MKLTLLGALVASIIGLLHGNAEKQGALAVVWAYAFGGTVLVMLVDMELRRRFLVFSPAEWHRLQAFHSTLDRLQDFHRALDQSRNA